MSARLAVFDCDGTLVDSQANICLAMEQCFTGHGLAAPARAEIRRIVGLSLIEAMAALLPDAPPEQHRAMAEDYKHAFQALRGNGGLTDEPLFDGVAEALDAFEAAGWRLGVATGKSDRGLSLILAHHGLTGRFVTLQTADRHPSKPHPSMLHAALAEAGAAAERSVMIGDTSFDMAMAVAAGVRPIGVAWGYHNAHELRDAGALVVADHAGELARLAAGTY
ncbi:haloacid dehalogenase [Sphingomonas spermidinifaciens]|uniref:Haloacid dehalogenase n=1 Tax=Sphingomonas spermidinifaciens TaxID=1141889 RepID=A0A2A4B1R1_9SPHN|nr:HAD-IA family hydrolase [Sphingomonas spermidinifaciens]PCD01678.1 haloacid dehalogenase [Sphingomonas spermidinifaciens]